MDLTTARTILRDLMWRYDLIPTGWTFDWHRAHRVLGRCNFTTKTISLSKVYVSLNDEACVRDTILHEIAHALVGHSHGHDNVWKLKAIEVGANPNRSKDVAVSAPAAWTATCPHCGITFKRYRLPRPGTRCKCTNRMQPEDRKYLSWSRPAYINNKAA